MKKILLGIFLFMGFLPTGLSQPCLPQGISFWRQGQIDSFPINYPYCTGIEGNVYIWNGSDITNLLGLSAIKTIGGNLIIEDNYSSLSSLTGLDSLQVVAGDLEIYNNYALAELTGLEQLTVIGGTLSIWLTGITTLSGLNNLHSIGSNISMGYNDNLISIAELINITSINGFLHITNNYSLPNLLGLDSLKQIGGEVELNANISLLSLTGLNNVIAIGGELFIQSNENLSSLSGLSKLSSIDGRLYIAINSQLTDLTGIDNISANSIQNLDIHDNPLLYLCDVQSVCNYLASPTGTVEIHDNAPGCNNQEEVETACNELDVPNNDISQVISIFPNPATDFLTINYPGSLCLDGVVFYDLLGNKVKLPRVRNNFIDVSKVSSGMYLLEIVFGQRIIRKKVLIN